MPSIDIGGDCIFYDCHEQGGDKNLLLVHGSGGDHTHWPEQLRRLDGINVYSIDLPGHGKSNGKGRHRVDDYADVVAEFAVEKKLSHVILFGHSLGGAIVQVLALREPPWLSRIVLVGTGVRLRVAPAILEALLTDFNGAVDQIIEWAYGPESSETLVLEGRRALLGNMPATVHGDYSACDGFDLTDRIHRIQLPTLVVAGGADILTPLKYGRYLHDRISGAKMVVVEGGGHMMALEKTEAFISCVSDFLRD